MATCPWIILLLLLLLANKLSSLWLLRLSQAVLRPLLPSWVGLCRPEIREEGSQFGPLNMLKVP